ncbi:MAG: hypothetical protein LCI02_03565 [Proteobacteria bacterium]|nr:hypothetical protein [Pseudomonadota bacterium]
MIVSYALDDGDHQRLQLAVARRFGAAHGWLSVHGLLQLLFWPLIGLAVAAIAWSIDEQASYRRYAYVIGTFFGAAIVVRLAAEHLARRAVIRAGLRTAAREIELELRPASFVARYGGMSLEVPWTSVDGTATDDRNLYLFLDSASALPVPKSLPDETIALITASIQQARAARNHSSASG